MNSKFARIGFVGGGAIGAALSEIFRVAGHKVDTWDQDQQKSTTTSLKALVAVSDILILCIPSWANREVATQIVEYTNLTTKKLVLSVAKGVEQGFVLLPDMFDEVSNGRYDFGLLYGPMLAEEIRTGKVASAILAVANPDWKNALKADGTNLHIEYSNDIKSIALCGVLKNVYALAFGLSDGLQLGHNAKGHLAVMSLAEMKQIVSSFGGEGSQVYGLAGMGDLLATGFSEYSFNYRIGKELAKGVDESGARGEGINSLSELAEATDLAKYPVVQLLSNIVEGKTEPLSLVEILS